MNEHRTRIEYNQVHLAVQDVLVGLLGSQELDRQQHDERFSTQNRLVEKFMLHTER